LLLITTKATTDFYKIILDKMRYGNLPEAIRGLKDHKVKCLWRKKIL